MLSLLKKQSTILDYVREWWGPRCACGNDIDVVWSPDEMDYDGQWANPAWFAMHCPECVVDHAHEEHRPSLRERYKRLRVERLSLGLGRVFPNTKLSSIDPDPSARRSLNWESGTITLKAISWRKHPKTGPNDLVMEQLMVTGTIAEDRPSHLDLDAIAALPWFDLQVREPTGYLSQPLELAHILLGATIRDPKRPGLAWRYSWNHSIPASYGFFSLPPYWQEHRYSPGVIGSFVSRAMDLFQVHDRGGRPSLVDSDCEWYFNEADRYVYERGVITPTKDEFLTFTGRPETTMRGHLKGCDLWPWEVFRDRAFMSPRARSR
jgi:hypothetical protein